MNIYKQTPDHYDALMTNGLKTHIYQTITDEIKTNLKPRRTLILDLCCGTGLLPEMLLNIPNIDYIGVDKNKAFVEEAKNKVKNRNNFRFVIKDALKYRTDLKFDIILLTSAYHHITNEFKSYLLKEIFEFLKDDGILIMYDAAIRSCQNEEEYKKSIDEFYLKKIAYLKKTESRGLTDRQLDALMSLYMLSANKKEEYKVDYDYIISDLNKTGLKIIKETRIWPKDDLFHNKKVGNFIFIIKKRLRPSSEKVTSQNRI